MSGRSAVGAFLASLMVAAMLAFNPPAAGDSSGGRPGKLWAPENTASTHRPSEEEALADARSFDLISGLKGSYADHIDAMKAVNPDLVQLVYMNGTYAQSDQGSEYPEDWYLRDETGSKVTSQNFGNFLMDPAHPGWIADRIAQAGEFLAISGYDGVMADMMGTAPVAPNYNSGRPINPATGALWTRAEWLQATSALAAEIRSVVAPGPLFVNGLGNGKRYYRPSDPSSQLLDAADGGLAEAWLRYAGAPIADYPTPEVWRQDLDMLLDAQERGRQILLLTKVWTEATQQQKNQWNRFAFASYLLGAGDGSHFSFQFERDGDPTESHHIWETDLGPPLGPFSEPAPGVFQRLFERGAALVNPTSSGVRVDLGRLYEKQNGKQVTSTWVPAQTGMLLTAVP